MDAFRSLGLISEPIDEIVFTKHGLGWSPARPACAVRRATRAVVRGGPRSSEWWHCGCREEGDRVSPFGRPSDVDHPNSAALEKCADPRALLYGHKTAEQLNKYIYYF